MADLKGLCSSLLLYLGFISLCHGAIHFPTYKNHPCARECEEGGSPMTCEYDFTVESYYVMPAACYDCPFNSSHCLLPYCVTADGYLRSIMTVNKIMPGPAIQVCKGDTVQVRVYNGLEGGDATSFHWHGLVMDGYQHHDGASMITQCPITLHATFHYKFKVTNRGTHYWHAHSGYQRGDGLFGAFVVKEPRSRDPSSSLYDLDLPEHVVFVHDWMRRLTMASVSEMVHNGALVSSPAMLINGRGKSDPFVHPETNETAHTPYSMFTVVKNRKYRFRIISAAVLKCPIQVSVDQHDLVVIATDGIPIEPVAVSSVNIYPGERYDVVLHANKDIDNYWLRARGQMDCAFQSLVQVAILRYEGAPDTEPTAPTDYQTSNRLGKTVNALNTIGSPENMYVSWLNSTAADPPDMKQVPDKIFHLISDAYLLWNHPNTPEGLPFFTVMLNRTNLLLPPSPLLTQYDDIPKDLFCDPVRHNMENCTENFCHCINVLKVDVGDTVEVVFVNEGTFPDLISHPIHLHGHHFRIVATEQFNGVFTLSEFQEMDRNGSISRNLENPVAKDTVALPTYGYAVVRFKTDVPGFWHFHCHVTVHNQYGQGVILQVGSLDEMPRPPRNFPRCGNWHYTGEEPLPKQCPTNASENLRYNVLYLLALIYGSKLWV